MFSALNLQDIFFIAAAYLLGSVSCAIVLCRLNGLADPRTLGSGNPGATNMLRTTSKGLAALTVLGDALKGYVPVLIAAQLDSSPLALSFIALAAVIGHLYPVFFQFRGGKGVATTFGVCLALSPLLGLGQIICWLVVAAPFRISSVAALVTAMVTPAMCYWLAPEFVIISATLAVLTIYRHKKNLTELFSGIKSSI